MCNVEGSSMVPSVTSVHVTDGIGDERGEYSSHQSLTITISPSILASRDPSNHQGLTISPSILPSGDNVIFPESSFFKHHGAHATLPTPSVVREEAAKPKNLPGRWANKRWAVPFFSMNLLVKYGTTLSIAEGQCMWAIRHTLGQQVPVPEVYGWCRDGKEVFIYILYAAHRRSNTRRCMGHLIADRPCIYPPRIASNRSISAVSSPTFWWLFRW
jgi:hypothetical protein